MSVGRVSIPRELSRLSAVRGAAIFLYATAMWILPSFFIGLMLDNWGFWAVPGILVLAVVGGYGVLLAGFVGHDGVHFALHRNKTFSVLTAVLATAPLVVIVEMGFALSHWQHHRHVGDKSDPDTEIFGRFHAFWSRALLARPAACLTYAKNALDYLRGKGPNFSFPLPKSTLRALCLVNLVACGIFLCLHVWLLIAFPAIECGFLIVLAAGSVVSGLSPYLEHAGTIAERGYETRTCTGLWWTIFLAGNNYHIEHHLYPQVPSYNLGKVNRILVRHGYYDDRRPHTHGLIETYRYTLGRYSYAPSPS